MVRSAFSKAMWVDNRVRTLAFFVLALLVSASIGVLFTAKPAHAKTFIVNTTADLPDPNLEDDACVVSIFGGCTLRAAIQQANDTAGADVINFNIPVRDINCDDTTKVCTISPDSALPRITDTVTVNGYSQTGAKANTLAKGSDAVLKIELDGTNAGGDLVGLSLGSGSSNSVIKGLVINRFDGYAIFVEPAATGNRVQGNFIGTNATGTQDLGNADGGVGIGGVTGGENIIGGTTPAARNLISGNDDHGVAVSSSNNQIVGNLIGTRKDGSRPLGNNHSGVSIGAAGNTVGGTDANVIAYNGGDGVSVFGDDSTGNRILRNSVFSNGDLSGDLGIDLKGDGPTPNDPKDPDTGPNLLQNKPSVTSATTSSLGSTIIRGRLNSTPNKTFTLQFFSNPSGNEGKTFIGQTSVSTNVDGAATFTFTPAQAVPVGRTITATATGPGGNTSEFSGPREVAAS